MAIKKYTISQTVKCNNVEKKVYASITCNEAELDAFLATLEGEYIVMGEIKRGGTDANVTSFNLLPRITFRAEGKKNISSAIFANNGGLVVKNGISVDEFAGIISAMHLFEDDATLKPDYTSIKPLITAGARL